MHQKQPISDNVSRFALILWLVAGACVHAQSPQGTILGRVTDSSGAVVAGAKVIIANELTEVSREVTATDAGEYTAPFLPVGSYRVRTEVPGFKRLTRTNIGLATGQTVRVDLSLEIGDLAGSVTVSGGGMQLVETDKPTLFDSFNSRRLTELPSTRQFVDFQAMTLGASPVNSSVINGGQRLTVNFVMDGVTVTERVRSIAPAWDVGGPSVESLEELSVKTSTMGSDTGLGTSEVHLSTRAGTNRFHGSLFEYYRGNFAEARNAFNATNKIPRTVRNQYGGSLGGPILKDRTFFFFNYDDLQLRQGDARRVTVPTAPMLQGNFSEYPNLKLRDPASGNTVAGQVQFPGNTIPASRISSVATNILKYFSYPQANLAGLTNNYQTSLVAPNYYRQFTVRMDHQLSGKDTLNGRLWRARNYRVNPQGYDMRTNVSYFDYSTTNANGTWIRILSPRITNEARFGFFDFPRAINPTDHGGDMFQALGIQGVTIVAPEIQKYGPQFTFGSTGSVASTGENQVFPQVLASRTYSFNNTLSLVSSRHSLRFGVQLQYVQMPFYSTGYGRGVIAFSGVQSPVSTGHAFADFLLAAPNNATLADTHPVRHLREESYSFFVADDWKVGPTLTLNLGVRYEYLTPLTEAGDQGLSSFDAPTRSVLVNSATLPAGKPTTVGTGAGLPVVTSRSVGLGNALQASDKNNVAPRFGFAWRPFGGTRTVLRGGYGIYYNDTCVLFTARQTYNAPWTLRRTYTSDVNTRLTTSTPFLVGSLQAPSFTSFDRNIRSQYSQQWNLTFEREIFANTAFRLAWVASKGVKLWTTQNIGQAIDVYRDASQKLVKVYSYPELSGATNWNSIGNSIYHSMQTEVRRRYANGLDLQANWVWAKHIDDDTDSANPQNSFDLRRERADSIYSSRHRVTVSAIYELPFGRGKRWMGTAPKAAALVLGGWRLSGFQQWYTGAFITPTFTNPLGVGGSRVDRVLGVGIMENVPAGLWFNPAAFSAPPVSSDKPSLVYGNSARNVIPTPNQFNMNMALSKSFPVREGHSFTIRAEVFNVPNNVNLGSPASNISNLVTVGRITSAGAARNFQWSARYDF